MVGDGSNESDDDAQNHRWSVENDELAYATSVGLSATASGQEFVLSFGNHVPPLGDEPTVIKTIAHVVLGRDLLGGLVARAVDLLSAEESADDHGDQSGG